MKDGSQTEEAMAFKAWWDRNYKPFLSEDDPLTKSDMLMAWMDGAEFMRKRFLGD